MKYILWLGIALFFTKLSLAQSPVLMPTSPGPDDHPKTVVYRLNVSDTMVHYSGKHAMAIAINGSIPAPTLYFTEGDTAEIYVHNDLKEQTIIHWHGVILPNQADGVPYLTTQPIDPGGTHLFKFPVVQAGTYWYHSHAGMQQQSGMYGALVFYKRLEPPGPQYTLLLSDWADMMPHQIERRLHTGTDWFAIKKGSMQSYGEALQQGYLKTKLTSEWKRMPAMDVSDVAYNRFLANGQQEQAYQSLKAGDSIRLRVVNGSSSTYFWLSYAGGKITVVGNDGQDIVPVTVDRLIVGVAETYDLIVTVPENKSYEFLATSEDRTGTASLWLGDGKQVAAHHWQRLNYFEGMKMMNGMMDMNGSMKMGGKSSMESMHMSIQAMDMNTVMYPEINGTDSAAGQTDLQTLNYGMLRATEKTVLPDAPYKLLHFVLTGNMNRYIWTINNQTVSEADRIHIHKGENVRIILTNNTMMRHPMHLHGHFFRVLNGQGDYSPLKHTVDIMPMETDTLEFAATESGDWFFHCHILYHMMSGMGRIFTYDDSSYVNPEVPDKAAAYRMVAMDDRKIRFSARGNLQNNGTEGEVMAANTRWQLNSSWNLGRNSQYGFESETILGRYLGRMQWWFPYIGFDYHYKKASAHDKNIFGSEDYTLFGQKSDKDDRKSPIIGIAYTLPLLFTADARIDDKGKFLFQLTRNDIPLTSRFRMNLMVNSDKEYEAGFRYVLSNYFSVSTNYDSDRKFGAGLTFLY